MSPSPVSRRGYSRARLIAWIGVLIVVCLLGVYTIRWNSRLTHGFAMYYTYSSMLLHGDDLTRVFDYQHFNIIIRQYGIAGVVDMPNNPPTVSLAMFALAVFPPAVAKTIWSICSLVLLGISIIVLLKVFSIDSRRIAYPFLVGLCFLWRPVYENIAFGQMYILLLFLFALALYGMKSRSFVTTALAVSISVVLKGYGILVMLWFGFHRMKKTLLLAGIAIALIFLLTTPVFTPKVWQRYWEQGIPNLLDSPSNAHVAYQTIAGFIDHMFHYEAQWSPHPLISLPQWFSTIITLLAVVLVIAGVLVEGRIEHNDPRLLLSFCAAVAVGVVTSPVAEEYHYTLFLPLVVGLSATFLEEFQKTRRLGLKEALFIPSILLLAAPLRYKLLQGVGFPFIFLAYPKLYAGLAILWCYRLAAIPRRTFRPANNAVRESH